MPIIYDAGMYTVTRTVTGLGGTSSVQKTINALPPSSGGGGRIPRCIEPPPDSLPTRM